MFFGNQPHIYKPSKGEGRLNAAFAKIWFLWKWQWVFIVSKAIQSGEANWSGEWMEMEKDKVMKRMMHALCCHHCFWLYLFTAVFIIHFLPHWRKFGVLTSPIFLWTCSKRHKHIFASCTTLLSYHAFGFKLSWIWVQVVHWASKEMSPGC